MPQKVAFIDAVTSVLKAWGYVSVNEPGDVALSVAEDFALEPRRWRWNGAAWVPFVPPPPPDRAAAAKAKATAVPAGPIREALDEIVKLF